MKKVALLVVCLAILTVGSVAAFASDGSSRLRAEIPFAFNVQNVAYEAGTYTLYLDNGFLHVRNESDKTEKAFLAVPASRANLKSNVELTFTSVDGKKYLTKIWGPGQHTGLEVTQSKKIAAELYAAGGSR